MFLVMMQPVFSASVLVDLMRPDGTSNTPVMGGETMSAELAHEIMGLQV
jgi:protein SMG9